MPSKTSLSVALGLITGVKAFKLLLYLIVNNSEINFLENLRISTFNVVSILSGTGYVTTDFSLWGKFPLVFFLLLMFVGGCAGSTTCGIKIFRFQILGKFMLMQVKKLVYLYYIGWKPKSTTRYSLMTGLAISKNDGRSFKRYSRSPILKLTNKEPFAILTAPYVMRIKKNKWFMWYVSCNE